MNVFNLLSYINKISLLAFFVTALILAYQIFVIKKDKKKDTNVKLNIPDFNDSMTMPVKNYTSLNEDKDQVQTKEKTPKKIIYSVMGLVFFCLLALLVLFLRSNYSSDTQEQLVETISPTLVVTKKPETVVVSPTVKLVPTRVPTTVNKEIVIASKISPTTLPTTMILKASPTAVVVTQSLPLSGSTQGTAIVAGISGLIILLAIIF